MGRMNWDKCYTDNAKPVFDDDERERRMIEMSLSYKGSDDEDTINRRRKKRKISNTGPLCKRPDTQGNTGTRGTG